MKGFNLCTPLLMAVVVAVVSADFSDSDLNKMSDDIYNYLNKKIQVLDQGDDPKTLKMKKREDREIGMKVGTIIKQIWNTIPNDRLKAAVKDTMQEIQNTPTENDSKISNMKNYLIKEGKNQAKSYLKHEVIKFIRKQEYVERCSCPVPTRCGCCVRPKGLEKCCLNFTALPEDRKFRIKLSYGGEQILGRKVSGSKEMMSCIHPKSPMNLMEICLISEGITEIDENNFRGCFRVAAHGISSDKCILFENGRTTVS